MDYLGYTVSRDILAPQSDKVEAVREFPTPVVLKSLRSFLRLASYYRRFIPQFSTVVSPLHVFTRRRHAIYLEFSLPRSLCVIEGETEVLLLAFPDIAKEFLLETDASGLGLGAVLVQPADDGAIRPITFAR